MIDARSRVGSVWSAALAVLGALVLAGLLILALWFLGGCGPPPPPTSAHMRCDYCRVDRDEVRGYSCESCKGMHFSCPVEVSMLNCASHWNCWITACPQKVEGAR